MIEIIAATVGGVFAIGAAVITVRWTRSRSAGDPMANQGALTDATAATGSPIPNAPQTPENPQRDVSINAEQYIQTNNGTVSQTNYRDGKR
ncbi:hypothetical protein AB0K02_18130 [Streptomyces sp. NPDC049597]|uniref:hypothetical protein n=1 Tax=Streptomyces sp. NPDC049597 TaxID=3155276 RepID=UPI00342F48D6